MKFSTTLFLIFPLFISQITAARIPGPLLVARQDNQRNGGGRNGGGRGGNNNQNQNNQGNNNQGNNNAGGAANNGTANGGAGNNNAAGNGNAADAQTSLTLDPRVVAKGFAQNGQNPPVDGQVASLTSTNNFINFCLTVPNLPITDGKQITTGSCNPAHIGAIPSVDNMPSAKFVFPKNGGTVAPNQAFTIQMAVKNLVTGNFVNAQANYFAAPQQLNGQGQIIGHSHVVVETLTSIDQTTPTDPKKFAFFKGLNAAAQGGVLTADVTAGLPAGAYRLCSINTSANHQPAIVPVAQHGMLDDCVYFTAGAAAAAGGGAAAGGAAAGGAAAGGAAAGGAAAGGAANNATATATAAGGQNTGAANNGGNANGGGRNNNGGNGRNNNQGQGQNRGGRNNRRFFRF